MIKRVKVIFALCIIRYESKSFRVQSRIRLISFVGEISYLYKLFDRYADNGIQNIAIKNASIQYSL